MNYDKEKVCKWHDQNIGLYTSIIRRIKKSKKVSFEGLCHIYDYALMLLLGKDFKPLYDPDNPIDALSNRFNDWEMSDSRGVFSMIFNTNKSLKVVNFARKTDNRECLVLYWLIEGDLYETILGRIIETSQKHSFIKSLKAIERKMIEDSLNHGIKNIEFWKELSFSPSPLLLFNESELSTILKPWDPELEFNMQNTTQNENNQQEPKQTEINSQDIKPAEANQENIQEAPKDSANETNQSVPEGIEPSVGGSSKDACENSIQGGKDQQEPESEPDGVTPQDAESPEANQEDFQKAYGNPAEKTIPNVPDISEPSVDESSKNIHETCPNIFKLFLSEDIVQNQKDAISLYDFINKAHSPRATIAAIYIFEKEKKIIEDYFSNIYSALQADISNINAYSTLRPIYRDYHDLTDISSKEMLYIRFQDEKKRTIAKKIFEKMNAFVESIQSGTQAKDPNHCMDLSATEESTTEP